MNVLIISTNRTKHLIPIVPNGAALTAAALRNTGHQVMLFDCCFTDDIIVSLTATVKSFRPDIIAISCRTCRFGKTEVPEIEITRQIISSLRNNRHSPIIIGGASFSFAPRIILEYTGADYGIVGESEMILPLLLNEIATNTHGENLPGVLWRNSQKEKKWTQVPPDRIPVPATDLYDSRYFNWTGSGVNMNCMKIENLQTRRGCPYACKNCLISEIEGKVIRARPLDAVFMEMDLIRKYSKRNRFFLVDNVFHLPTEYLMDFCRRMRSESSIWKWSAYICNGFENLSLEILQEIKASGCDGIIADIASLDNDILAAMGKSYTAGDIVRLSDSAKKIGIEILYHLTVGLPMETDKTARETFRIFEMINPPILPIVIGLTVYQGTTFSKELQGFSIKGDYPFSPSFYISPQLDFLKFKAVLSESISRNSNWYFASIFGEPFFEGIEKALIDVHAV
jgi:radical SAM superfamily enzyme YgiQ (UPF0313 family)